MNQYRQIFNLKKNDIQDQKILERLQKSLILNFTETNKVSVKWCERMMIDPDRPASKLQTGQNVLSTLILKDNLNINDYNNIDIPQIPQTGDICISFKKNGEIITNYYDFKSGDNVFYSSPQLFLKENESLLEKRIQEIKNSLQKKKNFNSSTIFIVLETPLTVPPDELTIIQKNLKIKFGVEILNPYESQNVSILIKEVENNEIVQIINEQTDFINKGINNTVDINDLNSEVNEFLKKNSLEKDEKEKCDFSDDF